MDQIMRGIVYLVGAGPGDPGLITVKGLECLRRADVVLYDRLVAPELLNEAPHRAELIDVGKEPKRHRRLQDEINSVMIAKAIEGKIVVRLKGGDPFVFGRGGEEAEALATAGIRFVLVPGVTSAIAVPAYAGIPVTHRDYASVFTIVTGHNCDSSEIDWASLPKDGTLVVLMGATRLIQIMEQLIDSGHAPETPVAVIEKGATDEQVVVEGTLSDIGEKAKGVTPPATIVVGQVVRLRRKLAWSDPIFIARQNSRVDGQANTTLFDYAYSQQWLKHKQ